MISTGSRPDKNQPERTRAARVSRSRPYEGLRDRRSRLPGPGVETAAGLRLSIIGASRARSSAGERSLHTREVAGSKPAVPMVHGAPRPRVRRGPGLSRLPPRPARDPGPAVTTIGRCRTRTEEGRSADFEPAAKPPRKAPQLRCRRLCDRGRAFRACDGESAARPGNRFRLVREGVHGRRAVAD